MQIHGHIQRIYLIGMMGAGKSTIAKALAQKLTWIWMDTDACVERKRGITIADVFALYGEADFRTSEWECVKETGKFKEVIVACGGGAPCFNDAMEYMLTSGRVFYLSAQIGTLVERLKTDDPVRPLLPGGEISIKTRLTALLHDREPVYLSAHHTIITDGNSVDTIVEEVLNYIRI